MSQDSESSASSEYIQIRNALLGLPRLSCPVGFEFRLQQRLEGRYVRDNSSHHSLNWLTGLTAGGLGVAAALSLAVFVFDFNPWQANHGVGQIASRSMSQPFVPVQTEAGQASYTGSPERLLATDSPQQDALTAAVKDSTPEAHRTALPEGRYQVVDGSNK
jgi:hypothetical protein